MAKGSKSRPGTRDLAEIATTVRSRPKVNLRLFEDLRTFDPEPATRPARLFSGVTATVGLDQAPQKRGTRRSQVPFRIAFTAPAETLVCVRRKQRREVLFAKSKAGKRGQKRPRWSKWSNVKC